jgi:hypothetical protein
VKCQKLDDDGVWDGCSAGLNVCETGPPLPFADREGDLMITGASPERERGADTHRGAGLGLALWPVSTPKGRVDEEGKDEKTTEC